MSNQVRCKVSLGLWLRAASRLQIPGLQPQREGGAGAEGRDVVAEVGRGWSGEGSGAVVLRAPQVIFPSAGTPVPRLTCARGRGAAGRVQPAVPLGPRVPGPAGPALSTSCTAGERAEPGPGGLCRRLRGRRAGHSLGTCRLTWPRPLRHRSTSVRLRSRDPSGGSGRSPPSGTVYPPSRSYLRFPPAPLSQLRRLLQEAF